MSTNGASRFRGARSRSSWRSRLSRIQVGSKLGCTYMSSSGEMKMSLREMICTSVRRGLQVTVMARRTHVLVLEMLEQLELAVSSLCEHRGAERLHNLLDGDMLVGELISGRTAAAIGQRVCLSSNVVVRRTRQGQKLPSQQAGDQSICYQSQTQCGESSFFVIAP